MKMEKQIVEQKMDEFVQRGSRRKSKGIFNGGAKKGRQKGLEKS